MKRAFVAPKLSTVASLARLTQTGAPISGDPVVGITTSDD